IVFGDLMRSQLRQGQIWRRLPQIFVRSHYLLSPMIGNIGILGLMLTPVLAFHPVLWAAAFMLPYFGLYISDLHRMGYRRSEIFGVCALNLALLPVNLAGILASISQIMGFPRRKFRRTP